MDSIFALAEYLPNSEGGFLPSWMLFVSSLAIFNSIQNYLTISLTQKIYTKANVTALQARTFAVWTLASAAIRLYAAYNITHPAFYQLAFVSYVLAWSHFVSEVVVYRTAGVSFGVIAPFIVASTSLVWMSLQYAFYVV